MPSTVYEGGRDDESSGARRRFLLPQPVLDEFDYLYDLSTRGAQSNILLCRRRSDGERVVLKWYRDLVDSFDVEAVEKLTELSRTDEARRHIAPVYDFKQWRGETWEVQEHFARGSLEDLYRRHAGPLPRTTMRAVLEELVEAVVFTHDHDIIHRDLAPSNILVRAEEPLDLVLADFGVARLQAASRVLGSVAGTMAYMAPDGSGGQTSKAVDWWSLGIILYEGLHGKHLFVTPDGRGLRPDGEIRFSLGQGRYEIDTTGDDRWDLLLRGLLTHDSQHRWGELEVTRWLKGESPAVHTKSVGPRTAVPPFAFHGENATPGELATAFRKDSVDAAELLANPRNVALLRSWLARHDLAEEAALVLEGQPAPGAAAVALQVLMNPAEQPAFGGRILSDKGFHEAAKAAQKGDTAAGEWIRRLREERALTAWGQQVEDGRAISLADDRLQRWWQRIQALPPKDRRALAVEAPEVEGLLFSAALGSEKNREERDRQARRALSRSAEVSEAFRPLAESALQGQGDSNFGVRLVTASQMPVELESERSRRASEQTTARQERRSARQQRFRGLRDDALTNFWQGVKNWFTTGAVLALAALVIEWRATEFGDAVAAVAPWVVGFLLLGGVLYGVRPLQHPRLQLLLSVLAVAWLWHGYLGDLVQQQALVPGTSLWQDAFLGLAAAGALAWASTFVPRFNRSTDTRLSSNLSRALSSTGRLQVVLWFCVMLAIVERFLPGVLRGIGPDAPGWYQEVLAAVIGWTEPLARLLPEGLVPWGAAGVLLATGVLRSLVGRHPLPVSSARLVLGVVALVLLVVLVGSLHAMPGAILLAGGALTLFWTWDVLVAVFQERTT